MVGAILGAAVGWVLAYLRLPFIERNEAFWVGFLACISVMLFIIMVMYVWNKHSLLMKVIGRGQSTGDSGSAVRAYTHIWFVVAAFIFLSGVVSTLLIHRQNRLFADHTARQNKRIQEQTEMLESLRKGNRVLLLSGVLDQVRDEIERDGGSLSDATVARLVALSHTFKPYRYFIGDSLSVTPLSPERGQLLLALVYMPIDSHSFNRIRSMATFAGADLNGADLRNVDLSGIDLRGAHLTDVVLTGANLSKAVLRDAHLAGIDMNRAILREADLTRADLKWAELNEADLTQARMDGARLAEARLRFATLTKASIRVADLRGALLNGADLSGAAINASDLTRATLSNCNLIGSDLRGATLMETDLTGADLTGATVQEENWLVELNRWRVFGAEQVQLRYKVMPDSSGQSKHHIGKVDSLPAGV